MKKPILTLPCKFNLTDFSQTEKGFHCKNCDKVLTDFRTASVEEINSKIKEDKSVCGIFHSEQVSSKTSRLHLPLWNSRVSLSLLGILGFLGPVVVSCDTVEEPIVEKKQKAFNVLKFPMRLSGVVRDQHTSEIIPNAELKIIQNGKIIRVEKTDANGAFDFFIQKSDLNNDTFDLVFKSTDFVADTLERLSFIEAKTKRIELSLQATIPSEKVKTEIVDMTLGEVACESIKGEVAPEHPVTAGIPMMEEDVQTPVLEVGKVAMPIKENSNPKKKVGKNK
jgi:hypothetical protein